MEATKDNLTPARREIRRRIATRTYAPFLRARPKKKKEAAIVHTKETFDIQEDIREEYMVLNWMNLSARSLPVNDD